MINQTDPSMIFPRVRGLGKVNIDVAFNTHVGRYVEIIVKPREVC